MWKGSYALLEEFVTDFPKTRRLWRIVRLRRQVRQQKKLLHHYLCNQSEELIDEIIKMRRNYKATKIATAIETKTHTLQKADELLGQLKRDESTGSPLLIKTIIDVHYQLKTLLADLEQLKKNKSDDGKTWAQL